MANYKELPSQGLSTGRSSYGQYGLADFGGGNLVPFLNFKRAEQLVQPGEVLKDFSHYRGEQSRDLGWSSNSASNVLARGAGAFDIQKIDDPVYGSMYTGDLNKTAQFLGIDPTKYQDKIVDEQVTDEFGNTSTASKLVTAQDQLYNAINEKGADYFKYVGDTLVPGQATEGGRANLQSVLYKREGDTLKPLTAPVATSGWQNADVYTGGSGFNFGRDLAPGLALVGGAALGMYGLDQLIGAGAGALGSGFAGLDAATAAELGLSGGSGLGITGAPGNVLAGIYGAEGLGSGFAGVSPELAAELGLQGTSGLGIEGASGDVLAGIPTGSTSAKDVLSAANRARLLANLLSGGQTGGQRMGMTQPNINMPQFEQFGGLYRGNVAPFLIDKTAQTAPLPQTQNFLEELGELGKPTDLASLLRNA